MPTHISQNNFPQNNLPFPPPPLSTSLLHFLTVSVGNLNCSRRNYNKLWCQTPKWLIYLHLLAVSGFYGQAAEGMEVGEEGAELRMMTSCKNDYKTINKKLISHMKCDALKKEEESRREVLHHILLHRLSATYRRCLE